MLRSLAPCLAILSALVLAGCSATGVLNALSPTRSLRIATDIAYAPGPRHGLDVYAPRNASRAPVVVFIYGGSWDSGARGDYAFVGSALARRGFVAIIPDYRLNPEVRFPAFLEDNAKAVRWAKDHAAAYGGDPDRLVLLGHSAGAYNTAMLAIDATWLNAVGLDPRRDLAGMMGLAGPYDFKISDANVRAVFGPPLPFARTQPVNFVRPGLPPILLATDTVDTDVQPRNTFSLAARLKAAGDRVQVITYPTLSHRTLIGAFAAPLQGLAPVVEDVERFVRGLPRGRPSA